MTMSKKYLLMAVLLGTSSTLWASDIELQGNGCTSEGERDVGIPISMQLAHGGSRDNFTFWTTDGKSYQNYHGIGSADGMAQVDLVKTAIITKKKIHLSCRGNGQYDRIGLGPLK